jgi:ubiquinone/menaquinone biosynthesis C-methylase UbiE
MGELPRLYTELAPWFHLLTAPSDYAHEASRYRAVFETLSPPPRTLLELGSGGGNNASHLKSRFEMTLVDLSEGMLDLSRRLNPECEHLRGDMRSVRLGRTFDAVFVHDAVMYLTSDGDLKRAMETAYVHTREGGGALFVPDCLRETFQEATERGGHDGDGRALRYLEWSWDPDPEDSTFRADFAYLLRERDGSVRALHDVHELGLFPREKWLSLLAEVGFSPRVVDLDIGDHGEVYEGFLAVK